MTKYLFQLEDNEKREIVTEEDFITIASSCIESGDSFYKLAFIGSTKDSDLMFSASTTSCVVFSCELYLKALLYLEKQLPKRRHDLDQLYDALSEEIQDKIFTLHPKGNCPVNLLPDYFYLQIKELRKGFEVFRYEYELNGLACNMQFLFELADTLRIIAAQECDKAISEMNLKNIKKTKKISDFLFTRMLVALGIYCCNKDSEAFRRFIQG